VTFGALELEFGRDRAWLKCFPEGSAFHKLLENLPKKAIDELSGEEAENSPVEIDESRNKYRLDFLMILACLMNADKNQNIAKAKLMLFLIGPEEDEDFNKCLSKTRFTKSKVFKNIVHIATHTMVKSGQYGYGFNKFFSSIEDEQKMELISMMKNKSFYQCAGFT